MKICLPLSIIVSLGLTILGCTFDYGSGEEERDRPDIVMENIEYVRVRGGDPIVRFRAEHAERWEDQQIMDIMNFSFEQFDNEWENSNAEGEAGSARIELNSGDVSMRGGVRISIESEDLIIQTENLGWNDNDRILSGGPEDAVEIERSDGTTFRGLGFSANARSRTWEFTGEVRGTFVETEDEDEGHEEEEDHEGEEE